MNADAKLGSAPCRRCQVALSWPSKVNNAGLESNLLELNMLELNTLSGFPTETGAGWTPELNFADDEADASPLTTVFTAVLNLKTVRVLVDCGSSLNVVSESLVKKNGIKTAATTSVNVCLADGHRHSCDRVLKDAKLKIGCVNDVLTLRVLPVQKYDVILGLPWLRKMNAVVDWKSGNLTVLKNGKLKKIKSIAAAAEAEEETRAGRRPDWLLGKKSFKKLLKQKGEEKIGVAAGNVCYMVAGEHIEELLLAEMDEEESADANVEDLLLLDELHLGKTAAAAATARAEKKLNNFSKNTLMFSLLVLLVYLLHDRCFLSTKGHPAG